VSFIDSGISAIGRLVAVGLLAVAFLFGMAGVVYMSLQGEEVKVPEITGKNLDESERELAALGLKIKKRADRVSAEAPNTVIEQLPKPGETVKTGQLILVVTSKGGGEAGAPEGLKPTSEEEDVEKIEEMISEKPKKAKANSNTNRKKADTARDVNAAGGSSNSNSVDSNSNKKDTTPGTPADKQPKNTQPGTPATKPGADSRPRVSNRP